MKQNENRAARQNLVRESLDRHNHRLDTAGPKTRVAYWLFAAIALIAIAAFVIGG